MHSAIGIAQWWGHISQTQKGKDFALRLQVDLFARIDFDDAGAEFVPSDGSAVNGTSEGSPRSVRENVDVPVFRIASEWSVYPMPDIRLAIDRRSTYFRSRSNIILPLQLSTAAAYLSRGDDIRSTRRCFRPGPGSLSMTKALSRLSKF